MPGRIAFVTRRDEPEVACDHTSRDDLLAEELRMRGYDVTGCVWDDPSVTWPSFNIVLIRSAWDYHFRPAAFRAWLAMLEENKVLVQNSVDIVRWNMDKQYLTELQKRGIDVVDTEFVKQGEQEVTVRSIMKVKGWQEAVVKPTVSCDGFNTIKVSSVDQASTTEDTFAQLLQTKQCLMVQRFMPNITSRGEWSLMYFGGQFSHAVNKRPKVSFKTQDCKAEDIQGTTRPPMEVRRAADRVMAILDRAPVYARVDLVEHEREDKVCLMELELVEPSLYLGHCGTAPRALADALLADCTHRALQESLA